MSDHLLRSNATAETQGQFFVCLPEFRTQVCLLTYNSSTNYAVATRNFQLSEPVQIPLGCRGTSARFPIHPIGPKTDVLVRFILFECIRDHLVALRNSAENGRIFLAKIRAMKSGWNLLQRTHPIHPIGH